MKYFFFILTSLMLLCSSEKNHYSVIGLSSSYSFLWYNTPGNFLYKLEDSTYVKGQWTYNDPKINAILDSLIQFDKPINDYPIEQFDTRVFIFRNHKDSLFISSMMILEHNETYYEIDRNLGFRLFKLYYDSQGEYTYK